VLETRLGECLVINGLELARSLQSAWAEFYGHEMGTAIGTGNRCCCLCAKAKASVISRITENYGHLVSLRLQVFETTSDEAVSHALALMIRVYADGPERRSLDAAISGCKLQMREEDMANDRSAFVRNERHGRLETFFRTQPVDEERLVVSAERHFLHLVALTSPLASDLTRTVHLPIKWTSMPIACQNRLSGRIFILVG